FGQQQPARLHELNGRDPHFLLDNATNLPRAEFELCGDLFQIGIVVDRALVDALRKQVSDPLRIVHRRQARRKLRAAAQAWAEASALGRLCTVKKAAVGFLRRANGTNRTAIYFCRSNADEKYAIKTWIAGRQSAVVVTSFSIHAAMIRL